MPSPLPLRADYDATKLRELACATPDAAQARRLLALADAYEGVPRAEAARRNAMQAQTLSGWVHAFNARGPEGLKNTPPPGRPSKLSPAQKREIGQLVDTGPDFEVDGIVRWRQVDLKAVIQERYAVALDRSSVGRLLKELGFSHISARPQHPNQDPQAIEAFKKDLPGQVATLTETLPPEAPVELWFADEMRAGQKNSTVYQWARRGTRPRQPADQRYENAYLFGAFCPARDAGAALIMPVANTQAMQLHLAEISATVAPGAHAIVLMDQAGWHTPAKLRIPDNLSLVFIPPASPELNSAENVWQYVRQTYLGNRVFRDYNEIVDRLCEAWRALLNESGRITSITYREWADIC